MNRRAALVGLAGLALSACRRDTLRTIRLASLPRFINAPMHLADELGFFREEGLILEVQPLTETTQMIPLLAAGQIDVTIGGATPAMFNAISQGARIGIVAARDVAIPGCTHEMHASRAAFPRGFRQAAELKGKRVAVTAPTSVTAFLLDVLLRSASLDTADVQLLTMRLSESAPALVAGQIDVVVDLDMGFDSPAVLTGPDVASLIPGFQYSYLHFGRTLLDGDIGAGAGFLRAYLRGVRASRAGTLPRAIDQLAQASGMSPDAVRTACRDRLTERAEIDPSSIERMREWASSKGFVRERVEIDRVIDRRFIDAVRM